jgi:hypothetical protein
MAHANFSILRQTDKFVILSDDGPWSKFPTITNDAEWVVAQVLPELNGRRLLYVDSDGQTDELIVDHNGEFAGFRAGPDVV